MADDDKGDLARFGWSSGEVSIIHPDGKKERIGDIPEEAKQFMRDYYKKYDLPIPDNLKDVLSESKSGAMDKLFRKIGIRK